MKFKSWLKNLITYLEKYHSIWDSRAYLEKSQSIWSYLTFLLGGLLHSAITLPKPYLRDLKPATVASGGGFSSP